MKRTIAFVLILAMALCMAPSVFAANRTVARVDSVASNVFYQYRGNAATRPEETKPGDEIIIPLRKSGFWDSNDELITWDSTYDPNNAGLYPMGPSRSQMLTNKVGVRMNILAGKEVIRDYEIVDFTPTSSVETRSAIRIRFVEDLVSTEEVEYRFTITVTLDGKSTDVSETFGGKMFNEVIEVEGGEDYVNIEDGVIAECTGTTDNIQVYLGNNVSVYTNMISGQKYYGIAKQDPSKADMDTFDKYTQVDAIYHLSTVNLINVASYVAFDLPETYHVYNAQGEYLGLSNQRLTYSTKYYLATEQIEDFEIIPEAIVETDTALLHPDLRRFMGLD